MLLFLLLFACVGYVLLAAFSIGKLRRAGSAGMESLLPPVGAFVAAGCVPLLVAAVMTYLFLVVGAATTVQYNAGSSPHMNAWSAWVRLWPPFLQITALSGFGTFVWVVVCLVCRSKRRWIVPAVCALLLSCLAFFTVASFFPSV